MGLSAKSYRYFKFAMYAAEMSGYPRAPMGAVAVYKGRVISAGWNSTKTSPVQQKYNQYRDLDGQAYVSPAIHAETACLIPIRNLDIDFSKVELYIYRKCKSREHGLARPCGACQKMIQDLGIHKIYYTGDDSYIYEEILHERN